MTKQEKKEGKVLINLLKNYHRHFTELPKVNRLHGANCTKFVRKKTRRTKALL